MKPPDMFQKAWAMLKRLLVGYGFLLSLVLIGITLALPFVLTSGLGLGLIPLELPLPRDVIRIVEVLSIGVTLIAGLRWLCFPSPGLDTRLANLHSDLQHSRNRLLLRFIGMLIALPLFAFILSPCALVWLGLEEALYRLDQTSTLFGHSYRTIAFVTGFIWLAVIVGRLCPPAGAIRRVVLHCRMIFIDWILEPYNSQAARREREKLQQCDCQIDS